MAVLLARPPEGVRTLRLVACPQCRMQLDVTDVERKSVRCRCGEAVDNRAPDGLDLEIHRCSSCGGSVVEGAEACAYCGSQIIRNRRNLSLICPRCYARNGDSDRFCSGCGGAFEPVQVDAFGEEVHCPDCDSPLSPHMVGDVRISECPYCNGLWAPEDRFDILMAKAVEAFQKAQLGSLDGLTPRMKGANPASQQVRYRTCLVCKGQMHRKNFRKSSGVIIDQCHRHGTWLDSDELERIAGFLVSGGRPGAEAALRQEAVSVAQRFEAGPFEPAPMRRAADLESFTPYESESDDDSPLGSIVKLLSLVLR